MLVKGLESTVLGLKREFYQLENVANNQANSHTPGFKQTLSGVRDGIFSQWRDDSTGSIENTGRELDLSLPEGHYFQVESGDRVLFTRRADLKRDQEGYLTVGSGERILDANGRPVKVKDLAHTVLGSDGSVIEGGKPVAVLGRFQVSAFTSSGGALLVAHPEATVSPSNVEVRTHTLESSNVDPSLNQTELLATVGRSRIYGQASVIQDSTIDRALREMFGR